MLTFDLYQGRVWKRQPFLCLRSSCRTKKRVPFSDHNKCQNDTEPTQAYIMSDSFPPRIVADMKPIPRPR